MSSACRRASRAASRTACSALVAAALAGCGGDSPPKLDHGDAAPLIALAHRIAHEGSRGQTRDIPRLQQRVIALINAGRVPAKLQERLAGDANALALDPSPRASKLEEWLKRYSR